MVFSSPPRAMSRRDLADSLERLTEKPWYIYEDTHDPRALFVREVLGSYLRSCRCRNCGMQFIGNQEPRGGYIKCPECYLSTYVEADDTFLKVMLPSQELKKARSVEGLEKEVGKLKPLEVFLDIPCFICGKPMPNNWTREEVAETFKKARRPHPMCWKTPAGDIVILEDIMRRRQRSGR